MSDFLKLLTTNLEGPFELLEILERIRVVTLQNLKPLNY